MHIIEKVENLKKLVDENLDDPALKSNYLSVYFFEFDYNDLEMTLSVQENVARLILYNSDFDGPWIEWVNF
jgi:hypothetical protein